MQPIRPVGSWISTLTALRTCAAPAAGRCVGILPPIDLAGLQRGHRGAGVGNDVPFDPVEMGDLSGRPSNSGAPPERGT